MSGIVLFGVGSPLVVEYEETCRRLGIAIVAGVKNAEAAVCLEGAIPLFDADAIPSHVVKTACVVPLFRPANRRAASEDATARGFMFADALIDPTAIIASSCRIGAGSFVNAGCILGASTNLSAAVVINRGSNIGHHVHMETMVSLGPGVVICGQVSIESGAMIGAGAIVLPSVRIGSNAVVGAGSVVVSDVPAGARVMGKPASIR